MAPPKPNPGDFRYHLFQAFVGVHKALYRVSRGRVGGWLAGPILLLTTTGRKTGLPRTLPLLYLKTQTGYALVASYGGSDRHPAWYLNLVDDPAVEIQVGAQRLQARAETAEPARRGELWPRFLEIYSDYDTYQKRTEREIPIVELTAVAS